MSVTSAAGQLPRQPSSWLTYDVRQNMKMNSYIGTYAIKTKPPGHAKDNMVRVFVIASSEADALAKVEAQAKIEGYEFGYRESFRLIDLINDHNVKEGIEKASEMSAYIETFERGFR